MPHDGGLNCRIKTCCGFVCEQQVGSTGECQCKGSALGLASGQSARDRGHHRLGISKSSLSEEVETSFHGMFLACIAKGTAKLAP